MHHLNRVDYQSPPWMKIKVDRRINKTQKSIRSALIELLSVKTRSQITVKELAEKADINRKTFYSHYENIDDIFDKIGDEVIQKLLLILERYDFFDSNLDVHSLFESLNKVLNEDLILYEKLIQSDSLDFLLIKIKEILKSTITEKYSEKFDIKRELFILYAEFAASGIISMYVEWFNSDKTITLDELGDSAGRIVFSGINSVLKEVETRD